MAETETEKRVILIVDDKSENLDLLISFLEEYDFYIKVADSGEEMFNRLEYCSHDIILLDIMMPGIDGFETCRRLKISDDYKDIPVIFMSALDDTVDKVKGLNLGAVDYITKPFVQAEVLARITNHLHIQELKNKLESANRTLEKRVKERTVELEITNQKLREEIEERKNAEKEISMLAHAIKSIRESVCVTDLDENVIFVNDAFVHTYGLKREEVLGKQIGSIISPKNTPKILNSILPETIKRGGWQGEIISQKKDGYEFHAFLSTSIIYDGNKVPVALIKVITDISERIKLEGQLRHAQKMQTVGNLAGGIAHDFNNYLTVIKGCTDLLKLNIGKNDPMFRLLEEISNSEKRAESLTRQLLLFSRKEIQEPKVLEMGNIVVGIENMLNRLMGDNIELVLDVITAHDYFYADRGQIEQVLMNLVINSRDAMHNGGKIFIKSQSVEIKEPVFWEDNETKPGWYIMISVSDTGIGMTKDVIARIFEPCYTTKEVGKGTGLGLSTVYGIVKQWKGFIDVTSKPEQGTTFKIYFPLTKEVPKKVEHVEKDTNSLSGHETVLVADDEDNVRNLVCQVLNMHGYRVMDAAHGVSALLKCEQYKEDIHLVLCDFVMPDMDGLQLVKLLQILRPEMKIIFMSGAVDNSEVISKIRKRNVAFLQKPFSPKALLKKIRKVLNYDTV